MEDGNWKIEIGRWKLENENRILKNGSCNLEIGKMKIIQAGLSRAEPHSRFPLSFPSIST
jgi:hypothetical protein